MRMSYEVRNQVLNGITLNEDDRMCVYYGGIVKNTTINRYGEMEVLEGVASDTVINEGGEMYIGTYGTTYGTPGTAYGVTVNAGGELDIAGGTVYNLVWTPCVGKVEIESGSVVTFASSLTGVYYGVNNVLQKNTQTMTGVNVTGDMCVMSGGSAYNSYVSGEGEIWVYSGGSVNNITVQDGGLFVMSGGTATNIIWTPCVGYMEYDDGATVTFTSKYSGVYYGSNGRLLSNTATMSNKEVEDCDCYVMSGGVANNFEVYEDGWLVVSGGTINNTLAEDDGEITVKLGVASNTTLQYGGEMDLKGSGGSAVKTNVGSYSQLKVRDGAIATNTTIKEFGIVDVEYDGTANSTTINGGNMYIEPAGTANSTTINYGGMVIESGGTANNTTVKSMGYMGIYTDGKHCGTLQMESGATVSAYSGAIIDFTVADRTSADDYLINNLALVKGTPTYTITVSADQKAGTYKLAQGASALNGSITICTQDTCFGTLTINGDALTYNDTTYQLTNAAGSLTLTVSDSVEPEPVFAAGKFNGVGGIFELTVDGIGYIHNAYTKLQLSGTLDSTKWEFVGAADFSGFGTEGLLWQDKETGYVYMQNNMTSFDEINNRQNCLGVVGKDYEILAAGDFTGTGINGVVMQGPVFGETSVSLNYGLPIWGREANGSTFNGWLGALVNTWQPNQALKGDISDLADINAKNYMYEVVSVGDYNGDGVDDVMLQNIMPKTVDGVTITGSGDIFTFLTGDINAVKAGASPTVAYAGCATDGWAVIGSGDFNGDGIDDTLLSNGTGVMAWQMANGQRAGDMWIGNLSGDDVILGIADLNNDGTDDILVRNIATETNHGWMISDGAIKNAVTLA